MKAIYYQQKTQYIPVAGTQGEDNSGGVEGSEVGEEQEAEENYGLFKTDTTKSAWDDFIVVVRVEKSEVGHGGGRRASEVFESTDWMPGP